MGCRGSQVRILSPRPNHVPDSFPIRHTVTLEINDVEPAALLIFMHIPSSVTNVQDIYQAAAEGASLVYWTPADPNGHFDLTFSWDVLPPMAEYAVYVERTVDTKLAGLRETVNSWLRRTEAEDELMTMITNPYALNCRWQGLLEQDVLNTLQSIRASRTDLG